MAKDFLPKVITWFRLDEHVRRLKEFVDSLTTRVETLENAPSGGSGAQTLQAVTTAGNTTNTNIGVISNEYRTIAAINTEENTIAALLNDGRLTLGKDSLGIAYIDAQLLEEEQYFQLPDESGTLVVDAPTDSQNYVRNDNTWVVAPSGGASELEKLTEVTTGWRLLGKNPANYGNIGANAVDFSESAFASATNGATGNKSFATGTSTIASGESSFATGDFAVASGTAAFSSGSSSIASGASSLVGGGESIASANSSVALGQTMFSRSFGEVAVGLYGTDYSPSSTFFWAATDRVFSVGNGQNFGTKSDALTILKNGTSIFNGIIRLKNYTVGTLPVGVQGDTAYVTDATAPTYLGALVGGGAVKCPVFYNGTAWVSH